MNGWEVDGKNLSSLDQDLVQKLAQNYPLCTYDRKNNRLFIIRKYSKENLQQAVNDEPFIYGLACFFEDSSVTYNLPTCEFTKISLVDLPNIYYLPHLFFEIDNLPNIRTLPIDIAIAMDVLSHMDDKKKETQFLSLNYQTIYYTEKEIKQKSVQSPLLGDLQQDDEFTDWWHSSAVSFPALNNQTLPVTYWSFNPEVDDNFIRHADTTLSNFLQISHEQFITTLSSVMHQFCVAHVKQSSQQKKLYQKFLEIADEQIWEYIAFADIGIARRSDGKVYLFLMANPEWDGDRNLEMIFEENGQFLTIRVR